MYTESGGIWLTAKTVSEKIFSRVTGKSAKAGDVVWATPDLIYVHDVLGPLTIRSLYEMGVKKVNYPGKIVFVSDHIFPPKDMESAQNILTMKEFAAENGIVHTGEGLGIEHTLLVENGTIQPGMLIVGGDSHTVTAGGVGAFGTGLGSTDIAATMAMRRNWFKVPESIKVELQGTKRKFISGKDIILRILGMLGVDGANYSTLEFSGEGLSQFNLDERLAIANMTVEGGAKAGIVVPDKMISDHYSRLGMAPELVIPDDEARYEKRVNINMNDLDPQIAMPYSPGNVRSVREMEGTAINQAYLGNCANGTITDLRQAASVLKGRTVKPGVKLIVVPATRRIYSQAIEEGLIKTFIDAGAVISPSTCGACAGLHLGILGNGEVAISNTNRNYRGRMGHPGSRVYLSNSYVVAASAVEGKIVNVEESL